MKLDFNFRKIESTDEEKINELMNKSYIYHKKLANNIFINLKVKLSGNQLEKQHLKYLKEMSVDEKFTLTYDYIGYVCTLNDKVIGFILGKLDDMKQFHICDIFVENKYRKIHVGKGLMNLLCLEVEFKKCHSIDLNCFKYNKIGNKFYKKLGYKLENTKGLVNQYYKNIDK